MNLFFWRKNRELDSLAMSMADEIYTLFPPEKIARLLEKAPKKEQRLFEREIDNAIARIERIKATRKLGVYAKARIHLTFMARLEELGYPHATARRINDVIIVHTAKW